MAGLGGILGNNVIQQLFLYQVVGQLIGAALTPYTNAIANQLNSATPLVPLSPADVAEATLRNITVPGSAEHEASLSGVSPERFAVMAQLAGNAPDPGSLAIALRRGIIDHGRFIKGVQQGRLRDEWADVVQALSVVQPSPQAMLDAYLEGQISESEARTLYAKLGGDPAFFDILYHTQGQAPTPTQALELANRGIIPWGGTGPNAVSYEQAFLEGPWRNKWEPAFRKLGQYLPPPRTVTAMLHDGSLSVAQATKLLEQQGLTPELAAAYVASASHTKTTKAKELAETTVLQLYRDRIISRAQAAGFVHDLGYTTEQADYILQVEDLRVAERYITAAVSRVHTLYVGHKLTDAQARQALADFGVDNAQAGDLVDLWTHERAANVRELTPAEVANAMVHEIIGQDAAQAKLVDMGYSPHDAWVYLSVHAKKALPSEPAA